MREQQENAIGASRTATSGPAQLLDYRRGLIVATIAGLLMTFLGGFGTADVPLGRRLAYWLVIMETGALIGIGASTGVRAWGKLARSPLLEGSAIALLISLPLTLVVLGTTLAFFGGRPPEPRAIAYTFVGVLVVTAAITAVNYARAWSVTNVVDAAPTAELPQPQASFSPSASGGERPPIMDRLPPHLRDAELQAIQSEDHYLRIHTTNGSALILLRMSDALDQLGGIEGARTHRSWWVARSAVQSVERSDGRAELTLTGDVLAPVSRSYMQHLRRHGWFD